MSIGRTLWCNSWLFVLNAPGVDDMSGIKSTDAVCGNVFVLLLIAFLSLLTNIVITSFSDPESLDPIGITASKHLCIPI